MMNSNGMSGSDSPNLEKHGIDFTDAARELLLPHLVPPARSEGEKRWVAVLPIEGRLAAVVYVVRNRRCRIISARIARRMSEKHITRVSASRLRRSGQARPTGRARTRSRGTRSKPPCGTTRPGPIFSTSTGRAPVVVVPKRKKRAISIRLDEDVVDFFKKQGERLSISHEQRAPPLHEPDEEVRGC